MASEESKDVLKDMDWKTASNAASDSSGPVTKKRLPKKIRQEQECCLRFGLRKRLKRIVESFGNLTDTESHSYGCSNSRHLESSEFLIS
ncbi:uncharacterized protein LOC141815355 isoform X2 [Curcuma longa]|uniref:uncharacterized protein LOC141815355 isoform X2 n=1 Tax=Curcuma longa TaxID=136217 RepID=UPI003D9F9C94